MVPVHWKSKFREIIMYKNEIVCGDSLKILQTFPDECIDMVVTSPPYNFGIEYDIYKDKHSQENYYKFLFPILKECIRVLKNGGRMAINIQPLFSEYVPVHHDITNYLRGEGLLWKGEILWDKSHYNCKSCAFGSWKSPAMPYLKYTWEFVEVFCKGTYKKTGNREDIDITRDEFVEWVKAKWDIKPESRMKEIGHPAMFPEELVERLLKLFTYKGDVVLDPFNGAGTTTLVARNLERNFIGIDISPKYCEIARRRLENFQGRLF